MTATIAYLQDARPGHVLHVGHFAEFELRMLIYVKRTPDIALFAYTREPSLFVFIGRNKQWSDLKIDRAFRGITFRGYLNIEQNQNKHKILVTQLVDLQLVTPLVWNAYLIVFQCKKRELKTFYAKDNWY